MTCASENLGTWMLQNFLVNYGQLIIEETNDRMESIERGALAACHMVGEHFHGLPSSLLDLVPLIGRKTIFPARARSKWDLGRSSAEYIWITCVLICVPCIYRADNVDIR